MPCFKHISSFLLCFYLVPSTLSAQVLSTWQSLYDRGLYCDLIPLFEDFERQTRSDSMVSIDIHLLMAKTYLELEKMESVVAQIMILESVDWKTESQLVQLDYQILLARYFTKRERWLEADSVFRKLLKAPTEDPSIRSKILGEYGMYLLHQQKPVDALPYLLTVDSLNPQATILSARVLNALAIIYMEQSKMRQAGRYFQRAKIIWESGDWEGSPYYWLLLNDYALYFYIRGDLLRADSFLTQSVEMQHAACLVPSIKAFNASARALILFGLGNHEAAIDTYENAFKLFMQVGNHKDASIALYKIAEANYFLDNTEDAQKYYLDALSLANNFFTTEKNPLRAQILMGLASIEEYNYRDQLADSLYRLAISIMEEVSGRNNMTFGTALSNYARFKEIMGDLHAALELYHQTESLDSALLGINHPDYKTTLYNLARTYSKLDSMPQVLAYYRKANKLQLKLLNGYFENFDASVRLSYRLEAMGNFDVFFSYACRSENQDLHREVQDINLATKNLALDYAASLHRFQEQNLSSTDNPIYKEWLQSRKSLTQLYFANNNEKSELGLSIDSLENRVTNLEKLVARQMASSYNSNTSIKTSQIVEKLAHNEAAIDFFNYYVTDEFGRLPDSILYYASILTAKDKNPKLVFLGSERRLKQVIESSTHYTHNVEVNRLLFEIIWAPLQPFLEDIEMVHISPEGLLHQISFGGLLTSATGTATLLDSYDFFYYSNLRDFAMSSAVKREFTSIYLLGDPDFGESRASATESSSTYFFAIPETGKEIADVSYLLSGPDIRVVLSQGVEASENQFYIMLDSLKPSVLHLATHGFFFDRDTSIKAPQTVGARIMGSELPLLRSGFVLSNANMFWNADSIVLSNADGIVTAREISEMNLSGTHLVVLSACETGRGAIADGEGVFGLQRAFKMAGSPELLITLWEVPDIATSQLMVQFYKYLLEGRTTSEALMQAQRTIKKHYPNPYYWAAFVLFK